MYQGIAQFNAGIGGTDEHTHRWYVHRMDAGHDDQELTAKIRETCLKKVGGSERNPCGGNKCQGKKKKEKKREEGTTSAMACEKNNYPFYVT